MRDVSNKSCRENQNTHFMFNNFYFRKLWLLCGNAEKLFLLCGNAEKLCLLCGNAEKLCLLCGNAEKLCLLCSNAEKLCLLCGNAEKTIVERVRPQMTTCTLHAGCLMLQTHTQNM
jgi:hypothetical protein